MGRISAAEKALREVEEKAAIAEEVSKIKLVPDVKTGKKEAEHGTLDKERALAGYKRVQIKSKKTGKIISCRPVDALEWVASGAGEVVS